MERDEDERIKGIRLVLSILRIISPDTLFET